MIAALAAAAVLASAPGAAPPAPYGLWRTPEDGGSVIRLEPCGEALCGRIVSSPHIRANPDQTDIRNKREDLRNRRLRDLLVLQARPIAPNQWGDGWIYNPEDGATYKGSITLSPDGALKLTGCVVVPFCRRETWRRAQAD